MADNGTTDIGTLEGAPAMLGSDLIRELAAYWLSLAEAAGGVPARQAIDPLALSAPVLPRIWLVDDEGDAAGFRFRLAGEAINTAFGRPVRRQPIAALFSDRLREHVVARFRRVVDEACACHCVGMVYVENERTGWGERLILPLTDGTGRVCHLVGLTDTDPANRLYAPAAKPTVTERFFPCTDLQALCAEPAAAAGAA
jgi:hypothetical protein